MKRRHVSVAVRCWKIRSSTSRYSATVDAEESTISVSKPSNDAELALVAERLTEAQTSRESTGLWRGSQGERSIWAERGQAFGLLHAKLRSDGRNYKWLILGVRTSTTY